MNTTSEMNITIPMENSTSEMNMTAPMENTTDTQEIGTSCNFYNDEWIFRAFVGGAFVAGALSVLLLCLVFRCCSR